jgi:hypothetical protein
MFNISPVTEDQLGIFISNLKKQGLYINKNESIYSINGYVVDSSKVDLNAQLLATTLTVGIIHKLHHITENRIDEVIRQDLGNIIV